MRQLFAITALLAAAPAAAQTFNAAQLVPAADSFAMFAGGQVRGHFVSTLTRDGGVIKQVNEITFGAQGPQRIELSYNALTLMPMSHAASGSSPAKVSITVSDGRAKGTVQRPSPAGLNTATIDAEVPAGTVEEEALHVLLPTLDLAPGFTMSVTTLLAPDGTLRKYDVTVGGPETVTVPAGTFEVYRVDAQSTTRLSFYVTTARPRKTVLVRFANGPEMRLLRSTPPK